MEGKLEKTDTIQDTNKKAEDPKNSGGNGKVDNKIGSPKKEDKEVCSKNKLDLEKHDFVDKELLQVMCLLCFYMAKILYSSVASVASVAMYIVFWSSLDLVWVFYCSSLAVFFSVVRSLIFKYL